MLSRHQIASITSAVAEEAVSDLVSLIRIPSVTGSEAAAQTWLANRLRDLGAEVDLWVPDRSELECHPAFAYVNSTDLDGRPNLVARFPGTGGGRSLILNGHIDVVPPGNRATWKHDPFGGEREGDRIYGRGACDMKSGLLAGIWAVVALRRAGVQLAGDVLIESVIGEEDGGVGTLATLVRGYKADAAIIMEPSRLAVVSHQGGAMLFRITVLGRNAHGSTRYEGVNALEKFFPIFQALQTLEAEYTIQAASDPLFRRYTIPAPTSIGIIRAGEWASTVPEQLVVEGRYGFYGTTVSEAKKRFELRVAAAAAMDPWLRTHPPRVEWFGAVWEPAVTPNDLVQAFVDAAEQALGRHVVVEGVPYGSDMRLLTNYGGIPTLIFGPGDIAVAHFTDEYVSIKEFMDAVRALAMFIANWCGTKEE